MKRRSVSSERSSIRWPSLAVPSVSSVRICVWPRVKSAEPCVRGETPTSHVIGRISSVAAAVRAALLDRDLAADELLVDRLGGPLDELLRQRVLDDRAVALDRRRADRERQLDGLDDPVEEQVALGRLELLRVLLGLGERAQVVLELLAHRPLDGVEPLLSRISVERSRGPASGGRCRPRSSSIESGAASSSEQLLDDRAGLAQPLGSGSARGSRRRAAARARR